MKDLIRRLKENYVLVISMVIGLIPLLWFVGRSGILIDGSDTNFPLNPAIWIARRLFVWNSDLGAGLNFSSSVAGLFFHFLQYLPYKLGASLQLTQLITLIFWFSGISLSAYFFSRVAFGKSKLSQLLFVGFYSLNTYLFNTWENVKVANLSLIAAIPLITGLYMLLNERRVGYKRIFLLVTIGGILLSGAGINPAYFLVLIVVLFVFFLFSFVLAREKREKYRVARNFGFILLILVGINFFWIIPTLNYIFSSISSNLSIQSIGYANWVDSLSQNTSILNVIRLQGAWDWYSFDSGSGLPLYIPYAVRYFYSLPFIVFSFIFFFLSVISLVFRRSEKIIYYLGFLVLMFLGIFLGVGTHAPTGSIYSFIAEKVPFFTLFRSPWYIFTPFLTFAYAGLIALFFYSLFHTSFLKSTGTIFKKGVIGFAVILFVGNIFYNYPLVTGKIFRPSLPDNFLIKFPSYVFEAFEWLNNNRDLEGSRVIGYPADDIERFTWGYNAVDSILALGYKGEVLTSSINQTESPVSKVIGEFYESLDKGEISAASKLARILNVGVIFDKKDQTTLSFGLPDNLRSEGKKIGEWGFIGFPERPLGKIFSAERVYVSSTFQEGEKILSVLSDKDVLVGPNDNQIQAIQYLTGKKLPIAIIAQNSQIGEFENYVKGKAEFADKFVPKDMLVVDFDFFVDKEGLYSPYLESFKLSEFGIDVDQNLKVTFNDRDEEWQMLERNDSYIKYQKVNFRRGMNKVSLRLVNDNIITAGSFNDTSSITKTSGSGSFQITKQGENSYLTVVNKDSQPFSLYNMVPGFDARTPYLMSIDYQSLYGETPTLEAQQATSQSFVKIHREDLPFAHEWENFNFFYEPVKTNSNLNLAITLPVADDPLGTKTLFDNLSVKKVFTNKLVLVEDSQESQPNVSVTSKKRSPVLYEGRVENDSGWFILVFSENYSPYWRIRVVEENGVRKEVAAPHFSANLYANGWYVNFPKNTKFEIYYDSQKYYTLGLVVSGGVLLLALGVFIISFRRKNE